MNTSFIPGLLRKKGVWLLLILSGLIYWGHRSLELRLQDHAYNTVLQDNPFGYQAEFHYQSFKDRTLRYVEIGRDAGPLIVFIHGAPSSSLFWQEMLRDSSLLAKARLMAVDRPGYGYSGYGRPETSVQQQAKFIGQVLREKAAQHDNIIIHGSSYGGTVAARLAMDYPDLVDGILLQSSSLKPGAEKTYWISYPTSHWALRWLMPGSIRTANAEKLSHQEQLNAMVPGWSQIKAAAIILHGTDDDLIYPDNAMFAYKKLINARYRDIKMLAERKHDLLWTKTELLKQSLLKLLRLSQFTDTPGAGYTAEEMK